MIDLINADDNVLVTLADAAFRLGLRDGKFTTKPSSIEQMCADLDAEGWFRGFTLRGFHRDYLRKVYGAAHAMVRRNTEERVMADKITNAKKRVTS